MEIKYTIIVKKKDTDEVLLEKDTNALIAGLVAGEDASSILLQGTHEEMIIAINMVQNELDRIFENDL